MRGVIAGGINQRWLHSNRTVAFKGEGVLTAAGGG